METIGIFGGTFDPPHLGHMIVASEACSQLGLSRLLWVLTPDPPHKREQAISSIEDRLEMVRLAVSVDPEFELSTVDLDRPSPHFALDTVRLVGEQYPRCELTYVMGGDSLRDLPFWHRPAEFVAACSHIGVIRRPDAAFDLASLERSLPGLAAKVCFVDSPLVDISAREIRARVNEKKPYRYFLLPGVREYIERNKLYLNYR